MVIAVFTSTPIGYRPIVIQKIIEININLLGRGGVKDARLEAKDTKKSKAKDTLTQDRPFRSEGQECSRPRIKGYNAEVLSERKKRLRSGICKIFSSFGVLQKKGLQKNFFASSLA